MPSILTITNGCSRCVQHCEYLATETWRRLQGNTNDHFSNVVKFVRGCLLLQQYNNDDDNDKDKTIMTIMNNSDDDNFINNKTTTESVTARTVTLTTIWSTINKLEKNSEQIWEKIYLLNKSSSYERDIYYLAQECSILLVLRAKFLAYRIVGGPPYLAIAAQFTP